MAYLRSPARVIPLFLTLAILWFGNIGVRTLTEPDEGRYAEIPREMLATGDWVMPRLNGIPYLEKPPLQYWATAGLYAALGIEPWTSRLFSVSLGFAAIVFAYHLGSLLYGTSEARCALLLLAGTPLFFLFGHLNTLDVGLTCFLTAALVALVHAQRSARGSRAERGWMLLAYLGLGLAVLQKGVVGLALPFLALGLYSLLTRDSAIWRRVHFGSGLAIVLVLNAPWWLLMQQRNPDFLRFFFVREHLERFLTTEHDRGQPWWFFIAVLIVGTLPWIGPIARGVGRAWVERKGDSARYNHVTDTGGSLLLASAAAVLLFYSPSGSKLASYLVPMLPPLAILGGRELARGHALRPSLVLGSVLALAMLGMRPIASNLLPSGLQREVLLEFSAWTLPAGLLLAAAIAGAWTFTARGEHPRATFAFGMGLVAAFALAMCGTNSIERQRGGAALAPMLSAALGPAAPFYCVGMYLQALPFALQRTCVVVDFKGELQVRYDDGENNYLPTLDAFLAAWHTSSDGAAIVKPESWEELQQRGIRARVLAETPYTVAIARQ